MVVMMMVMVMVMVTVHSGPNADVNAVMMVMMMSDHDLGGPGCTALRHPLIVGFQQR
jgi:hypothetical protein